MKTIWLTNLLFNKITIQLLVILKLFCNFNYLFQWLKVIELAIKLNELIDINQLKVTSGLLTLKTLSITISFQSSRKF